MPEVFEWRHTVHSDEIDELGHVNNLEYLKWMQHVAVEHSSAQGWTGERYRECGVAWVVRSHFIEYLKPIVLGDEIVIQTWVATMQRLTSIRKTRILHAKDNRILARAETNWAFIGVPQGIPRRILPEIIESFILVPEDPPL